MSTAVPATNHSEARQAAWFALSKIAGKEGVRNCLQAGASYDVQLRLSGTVDGLAVDQGVSATLSVGHDAVKSSSTAPKRAHFAAFILSRLNRQTQEKILREVPEEFAKAGNQLPDCDQLLINMAESLLKRLRAKVEETACGPVSCRYTLKAEA